MSISCLPQDLVASAACFECVPKQARRSVLTYLLCAWASKPNTPSWTANLIPSGLNYNQAAELLLPNGIWIKGDTYKIIFGLNDTDAIDNPNGLGGNPIDYQNDGSGTPFIVVATSNQLKLYGVNSNTPITLQLFRQL